ncbi:hypothetical protein J437_LFUL014814 [Ladona fulva]|uniref:Uncharacterized protein n=1 Tax=Ladona fulva TaxID=123851 RepID=A0A8K0KRG1_LADFU|nr:hypothetical protein J437_LFUL014814 [Ladona fulva]
MASFPTSTPKLSVKDSFDDDDVSDDIDDEVFIRDGRNGFKVDDERGKKPLSNILLNDRTNKFKVIYLGTIFQSIKSTQLHSDVCKGPPCRIFCAPCCYGILALAVLLGVIVLVVYLVNSYPSSLNDIAPFWKLPRTDVEYLPCTTLEVKDVWAKSFPKLTTESALRLVDVNKDGVLDVIIGYGTAWEPFLNLGVNLILGADGYNVPEWVCAVYFSSLEDATGTGLCLGGVLALDGENGNVLWQRPMRHEVFGLDCSADLTSDSINDCLATGRGGTAP